MAGKRWSKEQHAKFKATVAARKNGTPTHRQEYTTAQEYTAMAEERYSAIKLLAEVLRSLDDEKLVAMVKR